MQHHDLSAAQKAGRGAVAEVGVAESASCHFVRQSFATHLLERGWESSDLGSPRPKRPEDHNELHQWALLWTIGHAQPSGHFYGYKQLAGIAVSNG